MASIKGATSLLHTDYKIQREFERKGSALFNKGQSTSVANMPNKPTDSPSEEKTKSTTDLLIRKNSYDIKHTDTINFISPIGEYSQLTNVLFDVIPTDDDNKVNVRAYSISDNSTNILRGEIAINKRPLDPNVYNMYPGSEYLFFNFNIRPENGYYGWYVYNEINHNKNLKDKHNYVIELYDKVKIDTGIDNNYDSNLYQYQRFIPQHFPWGRNKIIVCGIIKPYIVYGGTTNIPWIDEITNTVKTNIVFEYKIIFGE